LSFPEKRLSQKNFGSIMECNYLCSKKNPSLLLESGSDYMESKVKKKGCEWTPAAVVAGSALSKS